MADEKPTPRAVMRLSLDCDRSCPMADNDRRGWTRCCIDWKFRKGPDFVFNCPHAERTNDE